MQCNKTFSQESTLKKHQQERHSKSEKYDCKSCNQAFSFQENLQKHESYFHTALKIKCGYCKTKLEDLEKLQTHVLKNHTCEPCNKTFPHRGYLSQHVKAFHDKEKKYACKFCNKTYPWRASLFGHIKSVHEKISFSCEFCNKPFTSKGYLKKHVKFFHDKE